MNFRNFINQNLIHILQIDIQSEISENISFEVAFKQTIFPNARADSASTEF